MRARWLIAAAMFLTSGCGDVPTRCTMDAECAPGTTCESGVCGAFSSHVPSGCATAAEAGPFDVVDHSTLETLLPGCWVGCQPPTATRGPAPANAIGWGFNHDLTRWWFLVDDGQGNPIPYQGFDQSGVVDVIWLGINTDQLQVNMVATGNLTFGVQPQFNEGTPVRMLAVGTDFVYVQPDATCDGVDGGTSDAPADMGSTAPFGGTCNANDVTAYDCPAVDGRRCTFCGDGTCRQPCHLDGNDCSSPQQCTPFGLTSVVMAGDCIGYDGFCK